MTFGLHERISHFILNKVGSKPHKIILETMIKPPAIFKELKIGIADLIFIKRFVS